MTEEIITLDYGSGGEKTAKLIESLLLPAFSDPALNELGDGAVLQGGERLVFSTDSFVVSPWRFPGGDIGKLCICGTVNDICMAGGLPKYISLSFILEEGFPVSDLKEIIASIAAEAKAAGVRVVTGDTKVVERGKGDGIYINTAGIGIRRDVLPDAAQRWKESGSLLPGRTAIREGDAVLVSGSVGCHGAAVMLSRAGISGGSACRSDCRPLHVLSEAALRSGEVRILRDPTRGGVATTLNEFTDGMMFSIELEENAIPVEEGVSAACELLGLDPLYCACEGRMLLVVPERDVEAELSALHAVPGGEKAARIGTVKSTHPGKVILRTGLGGSRILSRLAGQQLPRIC